jgi:hypothetical protein
MNDRAYRYLPIAFVGFVLLLVLSVPAAASGSAARGRAEGAAVLPPQAARCGTCLVAQKRCSVDCFGRADKSSLTACLIDCDNAAATCSCDEQVSLRSEDVAASFPWLAKVATKADACHSTTPCGSAYPSCASWSGYSDCDAPFCGIYRWCPDDCAEDFGCWGPALKQRQERFRVCFNAQGQSCTEYSSTQITLGCGC